MCLLKTAKYHQVFGYITVFFLNNSLVKMSNVKVIGNVLQILARVQNSFLDIDKILLSHNIFTCTLCPIEKSNLKVYDAEFHSNNVGSKSMILLKNVALTKNNVTKKMLHLTLGPTDTIQNNTLTESNVSKAVSNSFGMVEIQLNNVLFTRNNPQKALLKMQ